MKDILNYIKNFCGSGRKASLAIVLLIFIVTLLAANRSLAVEFKAHGLWQVIMQYGQNGNFTNHGHQGYNFTEDSFEAVSRARIWLDAVASENLNGQVYFEIGKFVWGQQSTGGALGADAAVVKLRRAYLDWVMPATDMKVRMGLQAIRTPHYALDGPTVLSADGAGITANAPLGENASISAFWIRPYNDNYIATGGQDDSGFMDNADFGGITFPVRLDGIAFTPFAIYGAIGPNTFRSDKGQFGNRISTPDGNYFLSGMFPLLANEKGIFKRDAGSYANVWWAGIGGELTMFEPWRFALEFTGGGTSWENASFLDRKGWLAAASLEYEFDWGVPGLYGWYGSGDDDDLGNGSERMPYMATDFGVASFGDTFAGPNENGLERDRVMANTLIGTWGLGLRLRKFSFVEDITHTIHISLWGGTNASGILEKIHARTGKWMSPNMAESGNPPMGRDNIYLTDKDYAFSAGLRNKWKIYENLDLNLDVGYIHLMLDMSDNVWGLASTGGGERGLRDAWNISALFNYSF